MKRGMTILFLLAVIIFVVVMYLTVLYTPKCKNLACWEEKLEKCSRASYFNDAKDLVWEYKIIGEKDDLCAVNVEAVKVKEGIIKVKVLEGNGMVCFLSMNDEGVTIIVDPESNINYCHGRLKEEMQSMIISNLYEYMVENLGEIGEELTGIDGVTETPEPIVNSSINSSV